MGSLMKRIRTAREKKELSNTLGLVEGIIRMNRSEEDRVEQLVEKLCRSNVSIDTKNSGGSGVVILAGKENILVTCRHVIEPAMRSGRRKSLKIYNGGKIVQAKTIIAAPYGIDLAMVELDRKIGPAAAMSFSRPKPGAGVIVIGAGMGIDNTVSMGIISKIIVEEGKRGFEYDVFQTDAVINPGNSGGGIFRASSGELIGITTYKLVRGKAQLAEGGFGVSAGTLSAIPKEKWKVIQLA